MTWNRFDHYIKTALGGALIVYGLAVIVVGLGLHRYKLLNDHGTLSHGAVVLLVIGALWGVLLVARNPPN